MSGRSRREAASFVVARNPQDDSRLPFLLRLPFEGDLVLKARAAWPATARVYCHRFEEPWPADAEVVEQTPVLVCRRRGAAIDLVLDRPRFSRSQFVFTQVKGREAVFWQTQKTARTANPGSRIPRRRSLAEPVSSTVDTRERYPYRFAQQHAELVRATVAAGDYAIHSPVGFVNSATVICRGILLTRSRLDSPFGTGQANASRPRLRAQATSGVGGLTAVSLDSAALPERGRSTPATPPGAIGVSLGALACEARFACKSDPTEFTNPTRTARSRSNLPTNSQRRPSPSRHGESTNTNCSAASSMNTKPRHDHSRP